ncbi:MAG: hypothetical protein J0M04_04150 [Verrucomicrobia bacterium]|nr:hypothetical protein [Verrucomicrobiota bacterium]
MNIRGILSAPLVFLTFGAYGLIHAAPENGAAPPAIPDELKPAVTAPAGSETKLRRLKEALDEPNPKLTATLREARLSLLTGKPVTDTELLGKLRTWHQAANRILQPPLAFPEWSAHDSQVVTLPYLYDGCKILALQARMDGDRQTADKIVGDLLRWSRDLSNANPIFVEFVIANNGRKRAFEFLFCDLKRHPEPVVRLSQIAKFASDYPPDTAARIESLKSDARWALAYLQREETKEESELNLKFAAASLKPPFDKLTADDLRGLPSDDAAESKRIIEHTIQDIACLKAGTPMMKWPTLNPKPTGHTLADYANRPNGLGDLLAEYGTSPTYTMLASLISHDLLITACIRWLELERDGKPITPEAFADLTDPADGKPLELDIQARVIRCRGIDGKHDTPEPGASPKPDVGAFMQGNDPCIAVPRWAKSSE